MQDKNQLDCYNDSKGKQPEYFESEQYFPTKYDWRLSNCDEKRSCRCKLKDDVEKHKFH